MKNIVFFSAHANGGLWSVLEWLFNSQSITWRAESSTPCIHGGDNATYICAAEVMTWIRCAIT